MTKRLPKDVPLPRGRPSLYREEYIEEVKSLMQQGYSKTAAAGAIGVCVDTLTNWAAEHPEFFRALKTGAASRTYKLETDLLSAQDGPTVTSRIFALKNASPEEWRDRREIAGDKDAPLSLTFKTVIEEKPE